MTQPTQAQIEAAAKALYEYANNHGAKDCSWTVYLGEAKAALTAAAQVGEPPFGPWWEEAKRTIERTTIERCAQVARDVGSDNTHDFAQTEYSRIANEIAAAILTLKDAP